MLAPLVPLPGGTELRLARGIDHLIPADADHLLRGGHADVVELLRKRHQEQLWAEFEQGQAGLQDWEEQRLAGEQRFNERQRAAYVQRVHQGLG